MEAIVDATIRVRSKSVYESVLDSLIRAGYKPMIAKVPGKTKKKYRACEDFKNAPDLDKVINEKTKLMVIWWSRRMIHRWGSDVPHLLIHKGILPGSWLVKTNLSKREQPSSSPKKMPRDFVFLPMQYSQDFSIREHCPISYAKFIMKVASFCASNGLPLVVKHHPDVLRRIHIVNNEWRTHELQKMNNVLKVCRRKYKCEIIVREGSIHRFFHHCKFMAGMNTMAHIDAMLNECVSFHCGSSSFMNSGSVVHNNNITEGMQQCLEMSPEEKQQLFQRQKAMIYYLYNRYSVWNDDDHNASEWTNSQKIDNVLNYMKGTKSDSK